MYNTNQTLITERIVKLFKKTVSEINKEITFTNQYSYIVEKIMSQDTKHKNYKKNITFFNRIQIIFNHLPHINQLVIREGLSPNPKYYKDRIKFKDYNDDQFDIKADTHLLVYFSYNNDDTNDNTNELRFKTKYG